MTGNYESLECRTEGELEITLKVLSDMVCCSSRDNTIEKIKAILEQRKHNDGVFIKTGCGETHHVKPSQEVSEIYIDGERVYPSSHDKTLGYWNIVYKDNGFIVKNTKCKDEYHFQHGSVGWITTKHGCKVKGIDAEGSGFIAVLVE